VAGVCTLQVQDAVLASKRKDTPHLVAPIKRYATSKLAAQWLETLAAEQAAAAPLLPSDAAKPGSAAAADAAAAPASKPGGFFGLVPQALLGGQGSQSSQQQQLQLQQQQQQLAVIDSCEFLVPGDVMSALMTQVVADPAYADIMKALLGSRDGQEMYLRNPASFNLPTGGIGMAAACSRLHVLVAERGKAAGLAEAGLRGAAGRFTGEHNANDGSFTCSLARVLTEPLRAGWYIGGCSSTRACMAECGVCASSNELMQLRCVRPSACLIRCV
jgi:hypothetical protein